MGAVFWGFSFYWWSHSKSVGGCAVRGCWCRDPALLGHCLQLGSGLRASLVWYRCYRQCAFLAFLHLSVQVGMHGNTALESGVRSRLLVKARCRISGGFCCLFGIFLPEDALFMVFAAAEGKHLPNQPRRRANPFMTRLCNPELRLCGGCLQQV